MLTLQPQAAIAVLNDIKNGKSYSRSAQHVQFTYNLSNLLSRRPRISGHTRNLVK